MSRIFKPCLLDLEEGKFIQLVMLVVMLVMLVVMLVVVLMPVVVVVVDCFFVDVGNIIGNFSLLFVGQIFLELWCSFWNVDSSFGGRFP